MVTLRSISRGGYLKEKLNKLKKMWATVGMDGLGQSWKNILRSSLILSNISVFPTTLIASLLDVNFMNV